MFAAQASELFKQADLVSARRIAKQYSAESHLAKIVLAGLLEYESIYANSPGAQVAKYVQQAMEREMLQLQYQYERGLGLLDACGRTSPFIGALGGSTFTFAFGIILAVPIIWLAIDLRTKTNLLLPLEMKAAAIEVATYMEKRGSESEQLERPS